MVEAIQRETLKKKLDNHDDFVLIEVLSEEDYEKAHIQGAINIPLKTVGSEVKDRFSQDQEIVVYCADENCQASPKAAQKLESLGFNNIKDYEGGKKDWMDAGYPIETGKQQ
jgi:rhodanese-related sulfurtransferase